MTNIQEIWKDINGYDGIYQVSNIGNVRSLGFEWVLNNGGKHKRGIRLLKNTTHHPKGYRYVMLYSKDGSRKSHSIHRLVITAFKGNPKNYPQINHIDGNKSNNDLSNLEWCNNSQNQIHAFLHGLNKPRFGEEHPSAVCVLQLSTGFIFNTIKEASECFGFHQSKFHKKNIQKRFDLTRL